MNRKSSVYIDSQSTQYMQNTIYKHRKNDTLYASCGHLFHLQHSAGMSVSVPSTSEHMEQYWTK